MKIIEIVGKPVEEQSTRGLLVRLNLIRSVIKLLSDDTSLSEDQREAVLEKRQGELKIVRDELIKRDALPKTQIGLSAADLSAVEGGRHGRR